MHFSHTGEFTDRLETENFFLSILLQAGKEASEALACIFFKRTFSGEKKVILKVVLKNPQD